MVKKPKAKGNAYESKIMYRLREIDPNSARTAGSGSSYKDVGDIINFKDRLLECKHHRTFGWAELIKYYKKICSEAKQSGKRPALIYKENYKPDMVMEEYKGRIHIVLFEDWFEIEKNV
jgi:Holliday junction resolvase